MKLAKQDEWISCIADLDEQAFLPDGKKISHVPGANFKDSDPSADITFDSSKVVFRRKGPN